MTIPAYRRQYLWLDIASRSDRYDMSVVNPTDFTTSLASSADRIGRLDGLLPYCFDAEAERVLYTDTPDTVRALSAPFLYQGQFAGAERLLSVPIERLPDLEPPIIGSPRFVFSVSRCGTTLLTTLLHHIGQPAASEPDIYTQVAAMPASAATRVGEAGRLALIRGCTAALARQIGPDVVIKLRDHCNEIASLMTRAVPEARVVFMLRDRLGWARSRHRAFADSPRALADILARGVTTYDALVQTGHQPVLIWYEDLVADPAGALRRLGVPEATLNPAGLAALLAADAQGGTSVSQSNLGTHQPADDVADQFETIWTEIAPRDLLHRHGLERLLPRAG